MITRAELNPHNYPETPEIKANLDVLLTALNKVRAEWGQPMIVTSGLRSIADQTRINPKAPKSSHLRGAAADIKDIDGSLNAWCKANTQFLKDSGIKAMEERQGPWQHFDIIARPSGHFWFNP